VLTYRPVTYPGRAQTDPESQPAVRPASRDITGLVLLCFGIELVGVSLLMIVSPTTFYAHVAPFGADNSHYIRDAATFQITLGICALFAARRPQWHVPVLAILSLQFALHSINHLVDIDGSDPSWLGPGTFIALASSTALLVWLLIRALGRQAGDTG
jgi:hypothetical protein